MLRLCYSSPIKGEFPWFDVVDAKPILVAWLACSFADEMEKHSDEEVVQRALSILENTYGKKVFDLYHSCKISKWRSEKFSQGSWSYVPVNCNVDQIINTLQTPINGKLFFCGEGTEKSFMGTVHGAFSSGVTVAAQILRGTLSKEEH